MFQEDKKETSQNVEVKSAYFHFENDITTKTIHVHSFSQQIILQYRESDRMIKGFDKSEKK